MTVSRIIDKKSGITTTTDAATAATVCAYTVPTNSNVMMEIVLVGKDSGTGDVATAKAEHRAKRAGGSPSLVGSVVNLVTFALGSDASLSTCVLTIDIYGNDVRIRVNGVIATTIEWFGSVIIYVN
jgi:hypothetical protein